jgi:predicted DNA-binding protein (MmcQ/YjbR family)
MQLTGFREYCLSLKCTTEELPFDDRTLVFKVMGKIFALCDLITFDSISLKCNPERAIELRAEHDCIKEGYHLSKKHWNTVELTGELNDIFLKELIKHSYDCVVAGLPKKTKLNEGL